MSNMERRFTELRVEVRLARSSEQDNRTIGGYAAVFNKRSDDLGGFYEVVAPSAFNQARGKDFPGVVALYNHDPSQLLGRSSSHTLRLGVDDTGLLYEIDMPDTTVGRDLYTLIQRGDVTQSSFAFRVAHEGGDSWEMDDNGHIRRTLHNVQLFDVSPVNTPAYPDSSVGVRANEVAFRSLAQQVEADPSEVLAAARERALNKFFRRSDNGGKPAQKPTLSGAELLRMVADKRLDA